MSQSILALEEENGHLCVTFFDYLKFKRKYFITESSSQNQKQTASCIHKPGTYLALDMRDQPSNPVGHEVTGLQPVGELLPGALLLSRPVGQSPGDSAPISCHMLLGTWWLVSLFSREGWQPRNQATGFGKNPDSARFFTFQYKSRPRNLHVKCPRNHKQNPPSPRGLTQPRF